VIIARATHPEAMQTEVRVALIGAAAPPPYAEELLGAWARRDTARMTGLTRGDRPQRTIASLLVPAYETGAP